MNGLRVYDFRPLADSVHTSTILSSTTVPHRLSPPEFADRIMMQALTQNIRYTVLENTNPTTTRGFQMKAGDPPIIIALTEFTTLQFIPEVANAVLEYEYGQPGS